MKRLSVSELAPESPVQSQFLVQSKERKISSNGSAYLDLELRDATGAIKAKVWDADRLRVDFEPGEVVRVEGPWILTKARRKSSYAPSRAAEPKR